MEFFEFKSSLFIVSHGTTIKTIVMNLSNSSTEWFNSEYSMENCSIKKVDTDIKVAEYIYGGTIKKLK